MTFFLYMEFKFNITNRIRVIEHDIKSVTESIKREIHGNFKSIEVSVMSHVQMAWFSFHLRSSYSVAQGEQEIQEKRVQKWVNSLLDVNDFDHNPKQPFLWMHIYMTNCIISKHEPRNIIFRFCYLKQLFSASFKCGRCKTI